MQRSPPSTTSHCHVTIISVFSLSTYWVSWFSWFPWFSSNSWYSWVSWASLMNKTTERVMFNSCVTSIKVGSTVCLDICRGGGAGGASSKEPLKKRWKHICTTASSERMLTHSQKALLMSLGVLSMVYCMWILYRHIACWHHGWINLIQTSQIKEEKNRCKHCPYNSAWPLRLKSARWLCCSSRALLWSSRSN